MTDRPNWATMPRQERIAAIRAVYTKDSTYTTLATELGCGRNAIAGMYNRCPELREECRVTGTVFSARKQSNVVKTPKPPVARVLSLTINRKSASPVTISAPMPIVPLFAAPSLRLTLDQTTSKTCMWPTDQDEAFHYFCGHPRAETGSYCAYHKHMSIGRGTESERRAERGIL